MRYLTVEEVLEINAAVMRGRHVLRDQGLLESAVARPQASAFGADAYPNLVTKAAALLHSLVLNHPFVDGNKRTAILATLVFLDLNGYQTMRLADQAADTVLRRKQELEEFDKHKLEFLGQDALFEQDVRTTMETGRYISPQELYALVNTYLQTFPKTRFQKSQGDNSWCLEPCQEFRRAMQAFIPNMAKTNPAQLEFLKRLQSLGPIPLTFSDEIAYERKLVEYVNLRHPLARAAQAYWQEQAQAQGEYPILIAHIRAHCQHKGQYAFFLFGLRTDAVRTEERLVPVVVSPKTMRVQPSLSQRFLQITLEGQEVRPGTLVGFDQHQFEQARKVALNYMIHLRSRDQQQASRVNDALVNSRLTSLEQTYEAKSARVRGYLANVDEPRIRRMREAQLRNLKDKFEADKAKLEARRVPAVTFSQKLDGVLWLNLE